MSTVDIGSIKVDFQCPSCGPCKVEIAEDEVQTISCAACGQSIGTKQEIDKKVAEKGLEMARKTVLDALRGR